MTVKVTYYFIYSSATGLYERFLKSIDYIAFNGRIIVNDEVNTIW
jgi:hypothetical protein